MLIVDLVESFSQHTVLVTGDTYVDRETYGSVQRLAPEAPVPVVKIERKRFVPGGAANVARSIAQLGGTALLYGHFGDDEPSRNILEALKKDQILTPPPAAGYRLPERSRIFASHQQLIQILQRPALCLQEGTPSPLKEFVEGAGQPFQSAVVYDQGYGFVNRALLDAILDAAAHHSAQVIIDGHPGHVDWYHGADLYTFNAEESLLASAKRGCRTDNLAQAGDFLRSTLAASVVITAGKSGISVFPSHGESVRIAASPVPIADRTGAGDSVTAVLALCLAAGADLKTSAELANRAAGIVVTKPGISYVEPRELLSLFHNEIRSLLLESVDVKQRLLREQLAAIENVVRTIVRIYRNGSKVYAFGNGGSAADANHFITELVGRFLIERKGLPAQSFSTNDILMTSIANDYGYENTFSRQVEAFVQPGDLVVAFSTSGRSRNVVKALQTARARQATTVGFTGDSAGEFPQLCDICIRVPSDSPPRIQESHLAVVHIICELLEKELAALEPRVKD
ncbi:MAG: PfkB family carbohydrate kinase [Acidobacteriota bacterium]